MLGALTLLSSHVSVPCQPTTHHLPSRASSLSASLTLSLNLSASLAKMSAFFILVCSEFSCVFLLFASLIQQSIPKSFPFPVIAHCSAGVDVSSITLSLYLLLFVVKIFLVFFLFLFRIPIFFSTVSRNSSRSFECIGVRLLVMLED